MKGLKLADTPKVSQCDCAQCSCLSQPSVAARNAITKTIWRVEGLFHLSGYSLLLKEIRAGTPAGQEGEAETMEECLLAYFQISDQLSDTDQDTLPKEGTSHSGLSPPASVSNQKTATTDMPTG